VDLPLRRAPITGAVECARALGQEREPSPLAPPVERHQRDDERREPDADEPGLHHGDRPRLQPATRSSTDRA
jgi:hypothetical protein